MPQLPVRSFDGINDQIVCFPGGADIYADWTVAALLRTTANKSQSVTQMYNAGGSPAGYALEIGSSLRLGAWAGVSGSGEPWSSNNFVPLSEWTIVAVSKPGGTMRPLLHRYSFATATWASEPGHATMTDTLPVGVDGRLRFGQYNSSWWYTGELAAIAMWDVALPATTVATLATVPALAAWAGIADPRALWLFDQPSADAAVLDLVGDAHEETHVGTTVVIADLPIPYHSATVALRDAGGWSDLPLSVHDGAGWTTPISVGAL
jgi:hypothetical protein